MHTIRFYLMLLLICSFTAIFAAESEAEIDPDSLKAQWWELFNRAPGTLEEKATLVIKKIESVIPTMTDSAKVETNELLQRITLNFSALQKADKVPPIAVPPITPASTTYPIDEVLDIARKAQSDALVLKNLKDERLDKLSQIDAVQAQMDRLAKVYFKSNEQNEERFILGLKLINYQITLALANEDLKRIENGIVGYEAYLKRLNDEVEIAESRLVSTPAELSKVERDRDAALREWEAAVQNLKQKEAEHLSQASHTDGDSSSTSNQLYEQQMLENFIYEMTAHVKYIGLESKADLMEFLISPENFDIAARSAQQKNWARTLTEISRRLTNFSTNAERQIQRTGQLISLSSSDDPAADILKENQKKVILTAQNNIFAAQKLQGNIEDARFLLEQLETRQNAEIGGSRRLGQLIGGYFSTFWSTISDWFDTPLFHIGAKPIQISSLLKVFLILLLTFWGSRKLIDWINQLAISKKRVEKALLYRITRLGYYVLLGIGVVLALTSLGFDLSSFVLVAGALGVGLGFGLQTIFNNFMSGIILLFESQIKVGDFIEIASGVRGEVKEINVRSTIIATNDGLDAIVPNSEIVSSRVVNWTLAHPYRKIRIPFSVAYGSDKDLVKKVIIEGTSRVPETLIKPGFSDPSVIMTSFGTSGLEFDLNVWVNEKFSKLPGQSVSDYLWMIDNTLKEHGIQIPFPRTDIHMIPPETQKESSSKHKEK